MSVPLRNRDLAARRFVHSTDYGHSDTDLTLLRGDGSNLGDDNSLLQRTPFSPLSIVKQLLSSMSKVPLFLRSSPAQGTGSYGALPVIRGSNFSSEAESSDHGDDNIDHVKRRSKRRGLISRSGTSRRSSLRPSETLNTRDSSISRYESAGRPQ
jgi:hypothetical protein